MAIKKFTGYEERAVGESTQLPVGSYVIEVKNVKYVEGDAEKSDRIDLLIDIAEGDQKDFFKKKYDSDDSENKKWKGKATIWCPTDDGSEADARTKRTFNSIMAFFAEANEGYHWNWEESSLKGKKIGATFRTEWNKDGDDEFSYTSFAWFTSADSVRKGSAKPANPKFRNGATGKASLQKKDDFVSVPESKEEEIPFL